MAQANPFDQFDGPAQPQIIGQRNPYKMPHEAAEVANAQADLAAKQQRAQLFPTDVRKAAADTSKAEADATLAQMKADSAKADAALSTMSANSDVHGDAYLQKYVPAAMRETVKAYARGDLGSRSGGLSTSMLPIIQHALNYDPTTSATNFPARVKMQSDLAGSQPNTAGGALRSMERMLLHGREVLTAGQGLNNFGPGLAGTIGNTLRTGYEQATNDPDVSRYNQLVRNYAPESQKAIAQTSGGVNERQEREDAYKASLPQAARVAALQGDARQAFDAMGAVNGQYKRLMGRDILDQLSPEAKKAYDLIMAGGYDGQGKPLHPASGYTPGSVFSGGDPEGGTGGGSVPPSGGPTNPYGYDPNQPQGDPRGTLTASTAQTINQDDPKVRGIVDGMIRAGKSGAEINGALQPLGYPGVQDADVKAAQDYLRKNPGYTGGFAQAVKPVEQTMMQRAGNAVGLSAPGAAAIGAYDGLNSLTFGGLGAASDTLTGLPGQSALAAQAAGQAHPLAKGVGEAIGTLPAFLGGGIGLARGAAAIGGDATVAGRLLASPLTADTLVGGYTGAGASPDNRLGGALGGAAAGMFGGVAGRTLARPLAALARTDTVGRGLNAVGNAFGQVQNVGGNALRGARGIAPEPFSPTPFSPAPAAPSGANAALLNAVQKPGVLPGIQAQLTEAQGLGVPMALADTHPSLTSLAGASVRRSPDAAQVAEQALLPRARGQIDRLGQAVNRDLGPVGNIPQISADMTAQARAAAGPLYDRAYAAPGASSVDLSDLTTRPSMKSGLNRAYSIAQEEGRDPTSLGFDLDAHGNPVLNRTPSFQTLDYVKRGLDDALEPHRDSLTGRLALNESTGAINKTKAALLSRVDAVNPDYAAARAAYAGPVQARDAMARGQDAFSLDPNSLGMQVAAQSPEHLGQMQLGYRSALMDRANSVRDVSNPFDATLGNPNARARVDTLYPGNPGNANLFRQRDLEGQLARTNNSVLGNSLTAQRQLADQAFETNPMLEAGLHAGAAVASHGASLPGTAARMATFGVKDAIKLGLGKNATAKADALAPLLLNTDPAASSATLSDIVNSSQAYRDFIAAQNRRIGRPSGMFGAALGAGLVGQ